MHGPDRWRVLAATWGVYAAFGLLIGLNGALVPQVRADLELTNTEMGIVLGAWQFVYILTAIPAGRITDALGARRAITISAVIMLGTALARTTATGFWSLLLPVALFGIGAPIISIGAPKVTASLFDGADRRKAVGLYGTAPAIGGVCALVLGPSVVGPLVDDDWRSITIALTALASVSLVTWLVASRGLDEVIAPGIGPRLGDYAALARRPIVAFVLVLAAVNFFATHGIGQWLVAMLTDVGWTNREAALWAAFGTFVGLVGTFTIPRFATVSRRPRILAAVLACGCLGLANLLTTAPVVLGLAIAASAIPRSTVMPMLSMILMDHDDVGPERIGAASGLFFSIAQIGGVLGPATTGAASEATGGFGLPIGIHIGVMVTMALAFVIVLPRLAPAER